MGELTAYISPELLVLVPVLYVVGLLLKRTEYVSDRLIPLLLGLVGIAISWLYEVMTLGLGLEAIFVGIIQGILCAGSAVYAREVYTQSKKVN